MFKLKIHTGGGSNVWQSNPQRYRIATHNPASLIYLFLVTQDGEQVRIRHLTGQLNPIVFIFQVVVMITLLFGLMVKWCIIVVDVSAVVIVANHLVLKELGQELLELINCNINVLILAVMVLEDLVIFQFHKHLGGINAS